MADSGSPLINLLAKVDFFADASTPALEQIANRSHRRELARGETLFAEGDTPHFLFIVISGRIAIVMSSELDDRESVVALMEDGDLFGELGLLDDGPRSAGARALSVSEVLEIPFEAVRAMLDDEPSLLWNAARMLARRLRAMDEVLADSVFLDVTGRTAKKIIELSGGREEFVLPVTQEELAGMVGASRERVNKAIASFARLGWLEQHERNYRIIERDRLENRAR